MAELFSNLADFKQYCGGAINTSMDIRSIEPIIADTARRHITPALSDAYYATLVTAAAGAPSGAEAAILPFVKRSLALLTIYEYAKVGSLEFGEAGLHRIENENRKTPFKYQENQYREYFLEKGYDALEVMLKFLSDNSGTYTAWRDSEEGTLHRNSLFNYAKTFRSLLSTNCDRYSFEAIRPLLQQVEVFAVEKLLPKSYWTAFKGRYVAGTLTAAEKELLKRIRMAMGHYALSEAQQLHWVQIRMGRVYVVEEFGESGAVNRTMPTLNDTGRYMANQTWADRHTNYWKDYICSNPTDFPGVFDTASGGTNTDDDAWHVNTTAEQAEIDAAVVEAKKGAVFYL